MLRQKLLLKVLVGSRGSNMHNLDSDYDYFGVTLDTKEQLFGVEPSALKYFNPEDKTSLIIPLHKYLKRLSGSEFNSVMPLFARLEEMEILDGRFKHYIVDNRQKFLTPSLVSSMYYMGANLARNESTQKINRLLLSYRIFHWINSILNTGDFCLWLNEDQQADAKILLQLDDPVKDLHNYLITRYVLDETLYKRVNSYKQKSMDIDWLNQQAVKLFEECLYAEPNVRG